MITYKQGGAVVGGGIRPCVFADFTVYEREKGGGKEIRVCGLEVEVEDGRRCGISGGDAGWVCGMMVGTAVESDGAKLRAVGNVLRREGKEGGGGGGGWLLWGVRVVHRFAAVEGDVAGEGGSGCCGD